MKSMDDMERGLYTAAWAQTYIDFVNNRPTPVRDEKTFKEFVERAILEATGMADLVVRHFREAEKPDNDPALCCVAFFTETGKWKYEEYVRFAVGPEPIRDIFAAALRAHLGISDTPTGPCTRWRMSGLIAVCMEPYHVSFWFPRETLCPVTLYELGTWTSHRIGKPIFVGAHPDYGRRRDVVLQTRLARGDDVVVHRRLEDLVAAVCGWAERKAENDAFHARLAGVLSDIAEKKECRRPPGRMFGTDYVGLAKEVFPVQEMPEGSTALYYQKFFPNPEPQKEIPMKKTEAQDRRALSARLERLANEQEELNTALFKMTLTDGRPDNVRLFHEGASQMLAIVGMQHDVLNSK